jgi:hypothetical protein
MIKIYEQVADTHLTLRIPKEAKGAFLRSLRNKTGKGYTQFMRDMIRDEYEIMWVDNRITMTQEDDGIQELQEEPIYQEPCPFPTHVPLSFKRDDSDENLYTP